MKPVTIRQTRFRVLLALAFFIFIWEFVAQLSSSFALSIEEIALLKTADRQRVLGKKEAKLLWYTTLIVNQALKPLKEAFEKKYPHVQVDYHRADSDALAQRMLAEYQAKRFDVDILDGTSTIVMLKKPVTCSATRRRSCAPIRLG